MKNNIIVLIIGFFLVSCSTDEIIPDSDNCKIKEYGKIITLGSSEIKYRYKLIYDGDKIMKRINYGDAAPSSAGLSFFGEVSRDSLVYDKYDRLYRIYKVPLNKNYSYSEFEYEHSNVLPTKRSEIFIFNQTHLYTYPEEIFYDKKGRVNRTVIDYKEANYEFNSTTIYEYDSSGNLIKVVNTQDENGNTFKIITELSDYDDKKNPFSSFPFIDYRGVSNSANNFRHYEITNYDNINISGIRSGTYNFEYNDFDYPLLGTYDCD